MKQCKVKIAEQGLKKNLKRAEMEVVVQQHEEKINAEEDNNKTIRFAGVEIRSQRIERYLHRRKRTKFEDDKQPDTGKFNYSTTIGKTEMYRHKVNILSPT
jgi:hypothetical protein